MSPLRGTGNLGFNNITKNAKLKKVKEKKNLKLLLCETERFCTSAGPNQEEHSGVK